MFGAVDSNAVVPLLSSVGYLVSGPTLESGAGRAVASPQRDQTGARRLTPRTRGGRLATASREVAGETLDCFRKQRPYEGRLSEANENTVTQYTDLAGSDEMMRHSHQMIMVPRLWSLFPAGPPSTLSWSVFPFNDGSRGQIPDEPGVYAFLIAPRLGGDLNVSYLMYVGETERTLRERFREYLIEAGSDRVRPKLLRIPSLVPRSPPVCMCATADSHRRQRR